MLWSFELQAAELCCNLQHQLNDQVQNSLKIHANSSSECSQSSLTKVPQNSQSITAKCTRWRMAEELGMIIALLHNSEPQPRTINCLHENVLQDNGGNKRQRVQKLGRPFYPYNDLDVGQRTICGGLGGCGCMGTCLGGFFLVISG